ncbi:MAG: hypothetical protein EOL98_11280 [Negativicutes bacterium]|nr:hypothetical protein [Negativicutes bacterium]
MMTESYEVEKLVGMIGEKRKYLAKLTNDFQQKKIQEEILFLEKQVLPILRRETTLLYSDITNYVEGKIADAVDADCNALLMFVPLGDITEKCVIGVINPKTQRIGQSNIDAMEISVDSMGVEGREIAVKNIEV